MAFKSALRSPVDLTDEYLRSDIAPNLLSDVARQLGKHRFTQEMREVFGQDIPDPTFGTLWDRLIDREITNPAIVLTEFLGYDADYDNRERIIRLDWGFLAASVRHPARHGWLLNVLLHEFGHHIDNVLRHDLGDRTDDGRPLLKPDAPHEEGHRFTQWLMKFATPSHDHMQIATYAGSDPSQAAKDVVVSWALAKAQIAAQLEAVDTCVESVSANPDRERFEAGSGGEHHQTHREIESVLAEVGLQTYEFQTIYFGNWLRDHSQLVDPKIVRAADMPKNFPKVLSREALTRVADVLSIKEFTVMRRDHPEHFLVSPDRLGVYRPSEHIDNPKTTDRNTPVPTDLDPDFEPLVFEDDPALEIDYDTSMKRYIERSADFMAKELDKAIKTRSWDGYRAFGSALHVLEDFFAHSNFVELALIKNGYTEVLPWTSPADCKAGLPLVTGTFGASDTVASLMGPLGEILFSPKDIVYQPLKAGDRSEREQILLILLSEHPNPSYLNTFEAFLNERDEWVEIPIVEFFQRCALYLQGAHAVIGNAAGIVMKDLLTQFGENIDDWQTRYGEDPHENGSTDPTHSQLAKDHAEHPLHLLAAELATDAVRAVAQAMVDYWTGDPNADPISVAKAYFTHPDDSEWQDEKVADWAAAHPEHIRASASKTELKGIAEQAANTCSNVLERMEKDGAAYLNFLRGEVQDRDSPFWMLVALGGGLNSALITGLELAGFFENEK